MREMFRSFLMACVAMLLAASLGFAPSNAAAMQDCAAQDMAMAHQEHGDLTQSGHVHSESAHPDQKTHSDAHLERHCANHSCVVALALVAETPKLQRNWLSAETLLSHDSLIALATPEGLSRPPRG